MTLKHAFIRAATIGLLVALTGPMSGAQTAAIAGQAGTFTMGPVSSPRADVAQYSIGVQDIESVRHVPLPPPPVPGLLGGKVDVSALDPVSGNKYTSLGSAKVFDSGLGQVLRLARVTVSPGGSLRLAELGGSGLVIVASGWLEVIERSNTTLLVRAPGKVSRAPLASSEVAMIDAADRFSFWPEATIVLHNRGERPAHLLTASAVGT